MKEHDNKFDFTYDKMAEVTDEIRSRFTDFIEKYLIENLKQLGFSFENRAVFVDFFQNNCYGIQDINNPNDYTFYLGSARDNTDVYIGGYKRGDERVLKKIPYTTEITYVLKPFPLKTDL